jgi:hypothetical protein
MDYAGILEDVIALIADTGRSTTFQTLSGVPVDSTKPWKGAGAPTVLSSLTTIATFVPPAGVDFGKSLISEEMLSRVEQVCLVAPSASYAIGGSHAVLDGSVRWRVAWAQELKPGDVSMLFALGLCR